MARSWIMVVTCSQGADIDAARFPGLAAGGSAGLAAGRRRPSGVGQGEANKTTWRPGRLSVPAACSDGECALTFDTLLSQVPVGRLKAKGG
jgi:hypothetical protein